MKTFILVAVCLIASASAFSAAPRGLDQDLQDFVNLLPKDKIKALALEYVLNDKEMQGAIEFFHGPEFAKIWAQFSANKEFKDFVHYLNDAGLPVVRGLNKLAALLGLPEFPGKFGASNMNDAVQATGGLKGFYDGLIALLPQDKIKALFHEKLETSKEFKELYEKCSSAEFQKIVQFVKDSPELTQVFKTLREHGIEVDRIIDIVVRILGWK